MGGRVHALVNQQDGSPMGPERVWLAKEDVPGLAMSRSIGDYVAHSVGVSAEPEVLEFDINIEDQIIIIASDGVWEFMSNEDVAKTVKQFYEKGAAEAAANAVVRKAT